MEIEDDTFDKSVSCQEPSRSNIYARHLSANSPIYAGNIFTFYDTLKP